MELTREQLIELRTYPEIGYVGGTRHKITDLIDTIDALQSRLETATGEALRVVADKLDRVAEGYKAGGHSHRAQMLHALAEETRTIPSDRIRLSADLHDLEVRKDEQTYLNTPERRAKIDTAIAAIKRELEGKT